ncbi:HAD family hydrolase [Pseudonocardia hispaniensis]|uniref:HAD family hydrolase n=1 Tax=Pseudonocardia hispaniensis TaxID=904933 RepID=A0ABW1IYT2_9PSEU
MTDVQRVVAAAHSELVLADLLMELREVVDRLVERIAVADVLDGFLLAAGAVQIVEDHLQPDTSPVRRGAQYLRGRGPGQLGARALEAIATTAERARLLGPAMRAAARWVGEAAAMRDALAHDLLDTGSIGDDERQLRDRAHRLRADLAGLPDGLTREILRLPSCFRSFDQQPADMVRLAMAYAHACPDRDRPTLVVGVRTSGSYLGPLVAAALRRAGFGRVRVSTIRPGVPAAREQRRMLQALGQAGGAVVVVDDPPGTGVALSAVAEQMHRCGLDRAAITLLVPLFEATPPARLHGYPTVTLPPDRWAVHDLLVPAAVAEALTPMLGRTVTEVRRVPAPNPEPGRGHVRARFHVVTADGRARLVEARGAGLGYFGRHALAVARATFRHVPETYGFADGLVFREWLPDARPLGTVDPAQVPVITEYLRDRASGLPATDRAQALTGRQPAWEIASRLLGRGFGRLGLLLRPGLIDPAVRTLCAVANPSVVDGATAAADWLTADGVLYKPDPDVRAFANTDRACYDPVYDVAGVDPGTSNPALATALRSAWPCDDDRFLLYELAHLEDRLGGDPRVRRAASRAAQRYLATRYPAGPVSVGGPLCALDIDGVLESDALGFPITTPTAMTALRALQQHGYRPVPVTGRCLDEVRDRCVAYGLAGGVAEYGAVVYDHRAGRVVELVEPAGLDVLAVVRRRLRETPGVQVDDDFRYSVRAYRGSGGRPAAVPGELLDGVLAGLDGIRVVPGYRQTDIVAAGTDKGRGLAALTRLLGAAPDRPAEVVLAVGDAEPDLPMFALARHAYAPGNAAEVVREAGITVLSRQYACGLAEAVTRLLGHRPGGCGRCAAQAPEPSARLLPALLDAQRGGRAGLPAAALHLAVELARARTSRTVT